MLLICTLAVSLGLILSRSENKNNPSENENNLKNLLFLTNATYSPSASPSISYVPSIHPTLNCYESTKPFSMDIIQHNLTGWTQTELFAHDSTWAVREACSGDIILECQSCTDDATHTNLFEHSYYRAEECLSPKKQYIFDFKASGGIGTCCGLAASKYTVTYNGVVLVGGEVTKLATDYTIEFGTYNESCPTTSPSKIPSFTPTLMPSEFTSTTPSSNAPSKQPSTTPTNQPTCNVNTDDFNLCFAIDMSGSVCNQGTGFECNWCEPTLICNADGVDPSSCCNNFVNVTDFAEGMISSLSLLESNQTYSVVQFATNASLVSSLTSPNRALDALDEMVYTGGCEYKVLFVYFFNLVLTRR
jgi:hypothetical protein